MHTIEIDKLESLLKSIQEKYKVDLVNYAYASLERRIDRFLKLHYFESIEKLQEKLLNDNEFYDLFIKEITVNTTEMFRDANCWKEIRSLIIPHLKNYPNIRIWHAGCSSGEEVFSMAILLKEEGLLDKATIIASDLNKSIIETARTGEYSIKSLELNNENYVQSGGKNSYSDYYTIYDKVYKMNTDLLNNVKFMKHDLSTGVPFSKFDLILCRNVLIYFNKDLQEKVFSMFQKSLFKHGFLVIGKKESMVYYSNYRMYNELCSTEKIYRLI